MIEMATTDRTQDLGGSRGIRPLGEAARELSFRVQVRLAEALLADSDPDVFRDAVALLANITRAGADSRSRMRAADLLLTHAERIAALGIGSKPAAEVNIDARQVHLQATVEGLERLATTPEGRAAARALLRDVAAPAGNGEAVGGKPETNGHGNGHVHGNGRG